MSNSNSSFFQGSYVTDIRNALIASALSGVHSVLLSAPGEGKTAIARRMANAIAGSDHVFLRLDGSTPPEKVMGAFDPGAALSSPPKLVRVVRGTAYDPDAKIVILDEIGRPNDVIFDSLLDVMDRQDVNPDDAPVIWGTSNFMPSSERTEAMRDRIGLWVWIKPDQISVRSVVKAQMQSLGGSMGVPGKMPTWNDVDAVRKSKPGENAIRAVSDVLETLVTEIANSSGNQFKINRRRLFQWQSILYRTGVYYSGDADFSTLPVQATDALKWAYPTQSYEEWAKWAEITSAVSDAVGTAIRGLLSEAYSKFREINSRSGNRTSLIMELGTAVGKAQENLSKFSDPRVEEAMSELMDTYARIIRGENPFAKED